MEDEVSLYKQKLMQQDLKDINVDEGSETQQVVVEQQQNIQPVDIPYTLEKKLVHKLDIMCIRCTNPVHKRDALLLNEGSEGEGKTSASWAEAGYIKAKTGREIHLFFRVADMLKFAQSTEDKIIIWDEPSLDSLSTDALTNVVKDLTRLFMTVRKKRHFFIINITKFWKFPEYIIVDRALGLIHIYSRKEQAGRFLFVRKKKLETLWNEFARQKKRSYAKLKSFGGKFPKMEKYFDSLDMFVNGKPHATLQDYELEKDKAINSIGDKKISKIEKKYKAMTDTLKYKLTNLIRKDVMTVTQLAELTEIPFRRVSEWAKMTPNDLILLEN